MAINGYNGNKTANKKVRFGLFWCKYNTMDVNKIHTTLQNLHLRKEFYLISLIVIVGLLIINYMVIPAITREGSSMRKFLYRIVNFLIALFAAGIAVGSVLFWLSGNH